MAQTMQQHVPNMPSYEMEPWSEYVSRRMAMARMARRNSGRSSMISSSTVGGQRPAGRAMRVSKSTSSSSSPHGNSVRSSLMSGFGRRIVPEMPMKNMATSQRPNAATLQQMTRPTTWHPSSQMIQDPSAMQRANLLRSRSVAHHPQQPFQQFDAFTSNLPTLPSDNFYFNNTNFPDQNVLDPNLSYTNSVYGLTTSQLAQLNLYSSQQTPYGPFNANAGCTAGMDTGLQYHMSDTQQLWAQPVQFPAGLPQSSGADSFLPIQYPEPDMSSQIAAPQIYPNEARGNELVGMGLYEDPRQQEMGKDDLNQGGATAMLSLNVTFGGQNPPSNLAQGAGKGLKLEEGWNPPANTDGDKDDTCTVEDSSDDEDSDAGQDQPPPPQRSLLDTSFFLDEGEGENLMDASSAVFPTAAGLDPAAAISFNKPQALDAPGFGNFTWI